MNIEQRHEIAAPRGTLAGEYRQKYLRASLDDIAGTASQWLEWSLRCGNGPCAIAHPSITRRSQASSTVRTLTRDLCRHIDAALLQEQWSPEQISCRSPMMGLPTVSHETITSTSSETSAPEATSTPIFSRLGRNGAIATVATIDAESFPIVVRSTIVDQRSRIGDWEINTVVGRSHQGALVTLVERRVGLLLM